MTRGLRGSITKKKITSPMIIQKERGREGGRDRERET